MTTQVEMTEKEIFELGESFVSGLGNISEARAKLKNVVTALISLAGEDIDRIPWQQGFRYNHLAPSGWVLCEHEGNFLVKWSSYYVYSYSEKKYYELPRGFVMQARREVGALVLGFMREFDFNVAVSQICDAGRE